MAPSLKPLLLLVLMVIGYRTAAGRGGAGRVDLWPMPKSVSSGAHTLYISKDLKMSTAGSKYSDGKAILKDAFQRMVAIIELDHVINGSSYEGLPVLSSVNVIVHSPDDELKFGVDESYRLSVPQTGNPMHAQIEKKRKKSFYTDTPDLIKTIQMMAQDCLADFKAEPDLIKWHKQFLERYTPWRKTFSQLCKFDFILSVIALHSAPWTIMDMPRFPYRGLLIDTARHYLPVPVIKSVIDSMAYSKLNVLHWHIVDEQSFPIEIPSYPKLWNGAYSYSEKYTIHDAVDIVQYAEKRGVNVLAEIDIPGHARSWGVGYPSLWPSASCPQPLDVSSEFTFKVIDGILSDFSKVFKFKFVHLGGDEVNTSCWTTTPRIKTWLVQHGMNESDAYRYFVLRAQKIAIAHGYEIINWEETFNNFGDKLDRRTVVHNWLGSGVAETVVSAGLRCIVSNQDKWYLDHLDATWEGFYMNEPLTNIYNPEQQKLVLGGEVCAWAEHIDASDIQQTIWPRAAAAAERLWTPVEKLAKDVTMVTARLAHFRCLLNERGVAAAPLAGYGRSAPSDPGSCVTQ